MSPRKTWRDLADTAQSLHPNGAQAVDTAKRARMKLADFSGIVTEGPTGCALPVLYFGDWQSGGKAYFIVQPGSVGKWTPVERLGEIIMPPSHQRRA